MPKPLIYDVVPLGDTWKLSLAADSEWELVGSKADVLARARELMLRAPGEVRVRVHSPAGEIESELVRPSTIATK